MGTLHIGRRFINEDKSASTISKRLRKLIKVSGRVKNFNKFYTGYEDYNIMVNKDLVLGANDLRDFIVVDFAKNRLAQNISTVTEHINCYGNIKKSNTWVKKTFGKVDDVKIFNARENNYVIMHIDWILEVYPQNNTIEFIVHGTFSQIDVIKELVLKTFEEIKTYISWIYDQHGSSATIPIDGKMIPHDEMYPFLNGEPLEDWYQRYMDSDASILILIGDPGTGKTSFIRGLLHSTESSASVTYDPKIVASDSLFSTFIDGSSSVLIFEDADTMLSARKDGNDMMHKFLNVGDGLVTTRGKKIIFSTNLPSVKDIDDALLRPGRCFDILEFRPLTSKEAEKLVKKLGIEYDTTKHEKHTIAEIFSGIRTSGRKQDTGFGFLGNK